MNIVKQRVCFYKQYCEHLPRRLHKLFYFGFFTLSNERIDSIRGNARCFVKNPRTAKSKAYRLLKNTKLRRLLPRLLVYTGFVTGESTVAIDFSAFGVWQVLMFALQTKRGRAIPVYFKVICYPIEKNSQNIFIIEAIEAFVVLVECKPRLVMDRGFACPSIINHLAQQEHSFIIRIKGVKQFTDLRGRLFKSRESKSNDRKVIGYDGLKLRLVISNKPVNGNEPWYLITNDFTSSRIEIVDYYYYRFEIEEFFKDAKWLQGLEHTRFNKMESIETVLWFVLIGWWCMYKISETLSSPFRHAKSHVSFPRYFFELMTLEKNLLILSFADPPTSPVAFPSFTRNALLRG